MYQLSSTWVDMLHHWLGVTWATTRIPGVSRGVGSKSKEY